MKRTLFLTLTMVMCIGNAHAFKYEPAEGLTWMGFFGMNVSTIQNHEYKAKAGATLGVKADYMLPSAHGTYLTAAFDWTMKGGKKSCEATVDNMSYDGTGKYVLHYLELPVRIGFRYNIRENFGLYAEVGPYFAVGVGGKHKLSIDGDGSDIGDAEDDGSFCAFKKSDNTERQTFQRWDAGVGFRLGAELNNHYNLLIGADWGLADIYRDSLRDAYFDKYKKRLPKAHNFIFNITLGYRF